MCAYYPIVIFSGRGRRSVTRVVSEVEGERREEYVER